MSAVRPLVFDAITKSTRQLRDAESLVGAGGVQMRLFNFFGRLSPIAGNVRLIMPSDTLFTKLYASVGNVSVDPISIRINKNDIPIETLTFNGNSSAVKPIAIEVTTTDYLTADITSANGGNNLIVTLVY